ncbi:ABC transporter permease [Bacillus tropicus]|nr:MULTISPECIES: ABC transporter permease [Bacillus cereus group]MCB4848643.1 ABC transporter permease [Bacillus tropicus]
MKKFWLVFKQSFLERVLSKAFILTTLFLVISSIALVSLPTIIDKFSDPSKKTKVVFIPEENSIPITSEELNNGLNTWDWEIGQENQLSDYNKRMQNKEIGGIFILTANQKNQPALKYYMKREDLSLIQQMKSFVQIKNTQQITNQHQLPIAAQQSIMSPISIEKQSLEENKEVSPLIIYLITLLIFMAIMMYGQAIATAVASEKASRVMEVMVTKVSPLAMIFGKIFGVGLACLTQFMIFFGATGVYLKSGLVKANASLMGFDLNFGVITLEHCIFFLVFFILGYFLYATLFAVFGSMVSRPEELSGTTMPINILLMVSIFVGIYEVLPNPNGLVAKITSYFPFTASTNMLIRVFSNSASTLEIGMSIVGLTVTMFLIGYFAAKVYPKGILHFGKNLKLHQLLNK